MNRYLLIILVVLVAAGALLTVAQVWGLGLGWDVYIKAVMTIGILVLLLAFLLVVKSDLGEHKKMKDENYLD